MRLADRVRTTPPAFDGHSYPVRLAFLSCFHAPLVGVGKPNPADLLWDLCAELVPGQDV